MSHPMMESDPLYSYRRAKNLIPRQVGMDLCLFDPTTSQLHILNPMAAAIWQHITPDRSLEAITHGFALSFGTDADIIQRIRLDVLAAVNDLKTKNLIMRADEESPQAPAKLQPPTTLTIPDPAISAIAEGGYTSPHIKTFAKHDLDSIFNLQHPLEGTMRTVADVWEYDDINTHLVMLRDAVRTTTFERAIKAIVKPGMTVMDFGCGTGILSFFASRCGVREVIAIDRSAILAVARVVGNANRFENIRFIRGDESSVNLSAPVDALVSECLGYFAVTERMIDAFLLARDRFLSPGGALCPRELRFFAHLVCRPDTYAQLDFLGTHPYGVDFSPVRDWPFHTVYVKAFSPDDVLPWAIDLGGIDLRKANCQPSKFEGGFTARRTADVYGLAGSFIAVLADDVILDTGPFAERTHWGQMFFPFRHPFVARAEQRVEVHLEARSTGENTHWQWSIKDDMVQIDMDDFVHRLWIQTQSMP